MDTLASGYIFEHKYRIQGPIGRGGFGTVYLAHQTGMDRHVALKVLNPHLDLHTAATARERFLREVRIISKLRHPHTVTIHDFGESKEGLVYMVLEFVEGETLKSLIRRRGALGEERTLDIGIQIAKSLSEAHRHGIIHRDLKPTNVMLTEVGTETDFVKVLDFGIARLRGKEDTEDLTSAGAASGQRALVGTPRYMSPEQVRGEDLSGASDVYSLGLILYEMLAGEPAVRGETTMTLITQQVSPNPLKLGALQRMHPRLQHVIIRSVAKDLRTRYRSVDILTQEMEQVLEEIRREGMRTPSSLHEISSPDEFILGNQYDAYRHTPSTTQDRSPHASTLPNREFDSSHFARHELDDQSPIDLDLDTTPSERFAPSTSSTSSFGAIGTRTERAEPIPLDVDEKLEARRKKRERSSPHSPPRRMRAETSGADVLGILVLFPLLAVVLYLSFLSTGAALALVIDGPARLGAALIATTLLLLGGGLTRSAPTRSVKPSLANQLRSSLFLSVILGMGALLLVSFALSAHVVDELRTAPNWFLQKGHTPQVVKTNRKVSSALANAIASTSKRVGLDARTTTPSTVPLDSPIPPSQSEHEEYVPRPTRRTLPAPTRPATKRAMEEELKKEKSRDKDALRQNKRKTKMPRQQAKGE